MAFKGSRLAALECRNIVSSKVMWVVIGAIAAMPLLYGALYLAAFSDPYERLNTVPVAVVNEDAGAVVDGEQRNFGDELVDQIEDTDDGLKWNFVTAPQAQEGLEDGTYYMTCTIPSNFSQDIASADSDAPQAALLSVSYNESKNMLASQIGESVWKEVRERVSTAVAKGYWETTFKSVEETGEDLQKAADGADELSSGLAEAHEGAGAVADGAGALADGEGKLASGLDKLTDGAKQLKSQGTSALASGAHDLASSTEGLSDNLGELATGTQKVEKGLGTALESIGSSDQPGQTLAYTSATVTKGLEDLSDGVSTMKTAADSLSGGLATLSGSVASLTQVSQSSGQKLASLVADIEGGSLTDAQIKARINEVIAQESALSAGLGAMKSAIGTAGTPGTTLAYGAASIATGLEQASSSLGSASSPGSTLIYGSSSVTAGLDTLAQGMDAAKTGAAQVASGATKAAEAAPSLSAGIAAVDKGASKVDSKMEKLAVGADDAQAGSEKLVRGATELSSGAKDLEEGLTPAVDGAAELGEKLAEGAQEAREQASNQAAKAEMMSDPVTLVKERFTAVKNYGTGFAPYFMALGLWVGALVAGFVFRPLNRRAVLSGGSPLLAAFSSFLPISLFSLIQATLLMVVLQFGLQLQIDNVPLFYVFGYLTAIVFAAIMQLLSAAFGFPGKFLAIILLMLQLTSCAGTFPIETTPEFFQTIYPFMPMTYVVEGMRQIMTGTNYGLVASDFAVIAVIGVACFALTCVVAHRKKTLRMEDLHPLLQLGA